MPGEDKTHSSGLIVSKHDYFLCQIISEINFSSGLKGAHIMIIMILIITIGTKRGLNYIDDDDDNDFDDNDDDDNIDDDDDEDDDVFSKNFFFFM